MDGKVEDQETARDPGDTRRLAAVVGLPTGGADGGEAFPGDPGFAGPDETPPAEDAGHVDQDGDTPLRQELESPPGEGPRGDDLLGRGGGPWDWERYPAVVRFASAAWPKDQEVVRQHYAAVLEDAKRADPETRGSWEIDWDQVEEEVARSAYFIAEAVNGRFLGLVGFEASKGIFGPIVHINTIYISPRARYHGGVLGMLAKRVEDEALKLGIKWVSGSFIYRRAAERLAKKFGYRTIGVNVLKGL